MASWTRRSEDSTDSESTERDRGSGEFMRVIRTASSVVIAIVTGVATYLAGVGGATTFPPRYVLPVAVFVTLGLFVVFYLDLSGNGPT